MLLFSKPAFSKPAFSKLGLAAGGILIALAVGLNPTPAQAGPIIYNFTGTVSGTVNGTVFTNQNISFFAFGDTANVTTTSVFGVSVPIVPVSPVQFALTGVGSGVILDQINVFDNQIKSVIGLNDMLKNDIFDEADPLFGTYGLTSGVAPIPTKSVLTLASFQTSLGTIAFTSESNTTFAAIAPAAVPEASTTVSFGLLLALGLGGLVVAARRKKTTAEANA